MNVSLARRKLMNEPSRYGGATADHSTSGAAVRRLGRIIQRIFLPNQEAALVEPLLPRGFFHLLVVVWHFISLPDVFPPGPTNCPGSARMIEQKSRRSPTGVPFQWVWKASREFKACKTVPFTAFSKDCFLFSDRKVTKSTLRDKIISINAREERWRSYLCRGIRYWINE